MFPRGDAGADSVARLALLVVAPVFGCRDFFGALGCVGVEPRVFDFAFFAGFLTDFLAAFFVTGFFAVFLPLLTTRLLFLARFFDAAASVVRASGDLPP